VTYGDGWTRGSTVSINKDLTYEKCFYYIALSIDSSDCFKDTLSEENYVWVNQMVDSLRNEKIDSIYNENCSDCSFSIIRIKYSDRTIQSIVIGERNFKNSQIASFASFIRDLPAEKYHADSSRIFETTRYLIPPRPPRLNIQFNPGEIKPDN
jgi:hypothetical protein